MNLPTVYLERMEKLLGEEFPAYLASFIEERTYGLRANTYKISPEKLRSLLEASMKPIPFLPEGFTYSEELRPARHPFYYAGLYYLQESSAMTPASVLPVVEGDRVLDLCAAPGGKATQLGARLQGSGVLYANDISVSRAGAMLKNLELAGIPNLYVTAETPEKLAVYFPEWFDKILVDAPCSGEGMFRKEPSMVRDWESKGPEYYAPVQKEILREAVTMLKPGGMLLYSTCTFSEEEDEEAVRYLLAEYPELHLKEIPLRPGFSKGFLSGTIRLWPHKLQGEGHFLALLQKEGEVSEKPALSPKPDRLPSYLKQTDFPAFQQLLNKPQPPGEWFLQKDRLYRLPACADRKAGLRYLRTGLLYGTFKNGRFTPSQPLAMALQAAAFENRVHFPAADPRVIRYLKGETITCEGASVHGGEGWALVCVGDYSLGWAKRKGTSLKNKYYAGWRWQ